MLSVTFPVDLRIHNYWCGTCSTFSLQVLSMFLSPPTPTAPAAKGKKARTGTWTLFSHLKWASTAAGEKKACVVTKFAIV